MMYPINLEPISNITLGEYLLGVAGSIFILAIFYWLESFQQWRELQNSWLFQAIIIAVFGIPMIIIILMEVVA